MMEDIEDKVFGALQVALDELARSRSRWNAAGELQTAWAARLEAAGVRRVGLLMGMIVEPAEGCARFVDPLGSSGNKSFVEMTEETAMKVAVLGLP